MDGARTGVLAYAQHCGRFPGDSTVPTLDYQSPRMPSGHKERTRGHGKWLVIVWIVALFIAVAVIAGGVWWLVVDHFSRPGEG